MIIIYSQLDLGDLGTADIMGRGELIEAPGLNLTEASEY